MDETDGVASRAGAGPLHERVASLEEEVKRLERERGWLLAQASVVHCDWNVAGGRGSFTPRFWKPLGYAPEEKLRACSDWQALVHPEDLPKASQALARHIETRGGAAVDVVLRCLHEDGHFVTLRCAGKVTEWARGGEAVRVSFLLSEGAELGQADRSAVDLAERTVEGADEIQRLHADLEQFAFVASHDLQAPLRHIRSFLAMIERALGAELDAQHAKWFGYVTEAAATMQLGLNDLARYARVDRSRLNLRSFRLDDVVKSVVEGLQGDAQRAGGDASRPADTMPVTMLVTYADLPTLVGDRSQIAQVVQELIDNAVKHHGGGEPPRITVTGEQHPDRWVIAVSDNGPGIPAGSLDEVFEPFRRLAGGSTSGSGIGLALVRKIVKRHGGHVELASVVGEGATFTFSIRRPQGGGSPSGPVAERG